MALAFPKFSFLPVGVSILLFVLSSDSVLTFECFAYFYNTLAVGLELLFLSRFIYNMVAMSDTNMEAWGYRWTFLSDHV